MGIKLFTFIRRAPELSPEEFHAYWRDEHARRLFDHPELLAHVRRFELNHRIAEDYAREQSAGEVASGGYDGVAVMWFDSRDHLDALLAGARRLEDDGPRFRAPETASVITDDASCIVDDPRRPDAQLKLLCILRRHADYETRLPEFHQHWLEHHGGLFQNIAELRDPLYGYDQNHGIGGADADFDGVTEQWFADLPQWVESLSVASHAEIVEPDVASFLDPVRMAFVLAGPPTVVVGD
jgi:hypothetical protein